MPSVPSSFTAPSSTIVVAPLPRRPSLPVIVKVRVPPFRSSKTMVTPSSLLEPS